MMQFLALHSAVAIPALIEILGGVALLYDKAVIRPRREQRRLAGPIPPDGSFGAGEIEITLTPNQVEAFYREARQKREVAARRNRSEAGAE